MNDENGIAYKISLRSKFLKDGEWIHNTDAPDVTTADITKQIKLMLHQIQQPDLPIPPPLCIYGAPKIGKSAIVKDIITQHNENSENENFLGFQRIECADWESRDLPIHYLKNCLISKDNTEGKKYVKNLIHNIFHPQTKKNVKCSNGGILLLEGLLRVSPESIYTITEFMKNRRIYGDHVLDSKWLVIATSERPYDEPKMLERYKAMSSKVFDGIRFANLVPDIDSWEERVNRTQNIKIDPLIIDFLKSTDSLNPEESYFYSAHATPDRWFLFAREINLRIYNENITNSAENKIIRDRYKTRYKDTTDEDYVPGTILLMSSMLDLDDKEIIDAAENSLLPYYIIKDFIQYKWDATDNNFLYQIMHNDCALTPKELEENPDLYSLQKHPNTFEIDQLLQNIYLHFRPIDSKSDNNPTLPEIVVIKCMAVLTASFPEKKLWIQGHFVDQLKRQFHILDNTSPSQSDSLLTKATFAFLSKSSLKKDQCNEDKGDDLQREADINMFKELIRNYDPTELNLTVKTHKRV